MWAFALFLILLSTVLFVRYPALLQHKPKFMTDRQAITSIKLIATTAIITALFVNIFYWKAESAIILSITLLGPFMFFAILNKTKVKK